MSQLLEKARLAIVNADEFLTEAKLLLQQGKPGRAYSIMCFMVEELAKAEIYMMENRGQKWFAGFDPKKKRKLRRIETNETKWNHLRKFYRFEHFLEVCNLVKSELGSRRLREESMISVKLGEITGAEIMLERRNAGLYVDIASQPCMPPSRSIPERQTMRLLHQVQAYRAWVGKQLRSPLRDRFAEINSEISRTENHP